MTNDEITERFLQLERRIESLEQILPDIEDLQSRVSEIGNYGQKTREELLALRMDVNDCLEKTDFLIEHAKNPAVKARAIDLQRRARARGKKIDRRLAA